MALLAGVRPLINAHDGDVGIFFPEPVHRVEELRVLEVICHQHDHALAVQGHRDHGSSRKGSTLRPYTLVRQRSAWVSDVWAMLRTATASTEIRLSLRSIRNHVSNEQALRRDYSGPSAVARGSSVVQHFGQRIAFMRIVALAGGVGAARFLRGMVRVVPGSDLTVVVNTGDDVMMHGLKVCPDLDSITYTLGGGADTTRGWGQADETYTVATQLAERYGQPDWFTLGDKDIATHLFRSKLLAEGVGLSAATAQIAAAWGLELTMLPMTDDPVTTRIHTVDGRDLHFQQWWVRERAAADVARVEFAGAGSAAPAPGVLEALSSADVVVLCPSNPVVSI